MKVENPKAPTVVHLIDRLTMGGLEKIILNFVDKTQGCKVNNIIVSLKEVNDSIGELRGDLPVYCVNKKPGLDLLCHYRLFKLLRTLSPDILHTYNLPALEYQFVGMLTGIQGRIHAEHGRDISDPNGANTKHNFLRRLMQIFLNRYIAVSEDLYNWLQEKVNLPSEKVLLIRNGINVDTFNNTKIPSSKLRLSVVARLSPIKDHQTLIRAIKLLKSTLNNGQLFELNIVGDGPTKEALMSLVDELKLNDCIRFHGNRCDIDIVLQETDVFVLSSIAEGIPMTILEAMAASTPVIATRVGGVPEVIEEGVHGILVDKQNPEQLAEAILRYMNDDQLKRLHGENARKRVVEYFNEERMIEEYLSCYSNSINKGNR